MPIDIRIGYAIDLSEAQAHEAAQAAGVVVDRTATVNGHPTVWGTVDDYEHISDELEDDVRVVFYR